MDIKHNYCTARLFSYLSHNLRSHSDSLYTLSAENQDKDNNPLQIPHPFKTNFYGSAGIKQALV